MSNMEEVKGEVVDAEKENRIRYFPIVRSRKGGNWFMTTVAADLADKNAVIIEARRCWSVQDFELKLIVVEL